VAMHVSIPHRDRPCTRYFRPTAHSSLADRTPGGLTRLKEVNRPRARLVA